MLPLTPATPRPDPYLERGERLLWVEATGEYQGGGVRESLYAGILHLPVPSALGLWDNASLPRL